MIMTTETKRLVCGAGIVDTDIDLKENGRYINQYRTWRAMIRQAYGVNIKNRRVEGLTVCADWLYFSKYKAWFDFNKKERFYVSRDFKIPGNKHYSPETCIFVPYSWGRLLSLDVIDAKTIYEEMERCRTEYGHDKEFMKLVDEILSRY